MTIRYHRLARTDLREIVTRLKTQDYTGSLHRRFLVSFDRACEALLRFPQIGRIEPVQQAGLSTQHDLRRLPISRFPKSLIFYTVEDDALLIRRILHSARNPSLRLANPPE